MASDFRSFNRFAELDDLLGEKHAAGDSSRWIMREVNPTDTTHLRRSNAMKRVWARKRAAGPA